MPYRLFPYFIANLAADFPFESAHPAKQETGCIGTCRLPPLEFDDNSPLLLKNVQMTGVGEIPVELLRNCEFLPIDGNSEYLGYNARNTPVNSPYP